MSMCMYMYLSMCMYVSMCMFVFKISGLKYSFF